MEISLPIILYLHSMWLKSSPSEKSRLHTFSGFRTFASHNLWAELYLFTLSIPRVARDQVWYERPSFYNSNFSKPNGSASLFGEAQLDNTKLRNDGTRLSPLLCFAGHKNPDALGDCFK